MGKMTDGGYRCYTMRQRSALLRLLFFAVVWFVFCAAWRIEIDWLMLLIFGIYIWLVLWPFARALCGIGWSLRLDRDGMTVCREIVPVSGARGGYLRWGNIVAVECFTRYSSALTDIFIVSGLLTRCFFGAYLMSVKLCPYFDRGVYVRIRYRHDGLLSARPERDDTASRIFRHSSCNEMIVKISLLDGDSKAIFQQLQGYVMNGKIIENGIFD